jgi:hypothetical protein
MNKRAALVSALLLAGLVVAVVGATAALRLIGTGAFGPGGQPMSQADVQQALAAQPPTTPAQRSPQPTPTGKSPAGRPSQQASPTPQPVRGSFSSSGNTVLANCQSGQVTLTGLIPAQGFGTDGYFKGPAASAWVKFKSSATEVTVTARCGGGAPRFSALADDNHGGGGGGHDGGGDDNGGGSGRSRGGSGH